MDNISLSILGVCVFFVVFLFVLFLICTKTSEENNDNYNKNDAVDTNIKYSFSNKDVEEKYRRINENMRQKYLRDRKRSLKAFYVTLSCIAFVLSIACLFSLLYTKERLLLHIILCSSLFIISVFLLIVLTVKLKRDEKVLIFAQLKKVIKKHYKSITPKKVNKYQPYVQQNSEMFQNIKKLNSQYVFDRNTCREHQYNEYLNNKRQFDNFNCNNWILQKYRYNPTFFQKLQQIYEDNSERYKVYTKLYDQSEKYKTEIEIENGKLDYETFNYIEKKLFKECRQKAITKPSITLYFSYTSPSGRNHYSDSHTYTYSDLLEIVNQSKEQEKILAAEQTKKEQLAAEKRAKAAKLRSLDKKEQELAKKELEINKKEQEFLDATKDHIYTTQTITVNDGNVDFNESMTISQKMKILRDKFDNGEITYLEYQARRKELL